MIKKNTILFLILIFPFLEPTVFEYRGGFIDYIFMVWKLLSTIYIFLSYVHDVKKNGINKVMIAIILYQLLRIIVNIINGISINEVIGNVLSILGFSCLIDYYIRREPKMVIKVLYFIFNIFLIINYFSYNFNILKFFDNIYFLGMRTRFTDVAYCLIVISFLQYHFTKNKFGLVFSNLLGICNILMASVTTGMIGLVIFYAIFIFLNITKRKYVNWYIPFLTSSIIFNVSIVFFRIQERFAYIIQQIFHKNLTFTGRTLIWDSALDKIADSKMIGHGFYNNGKFAYYRGIVWQAHNQILQIFYETGYIGLIAFIFILISCSKKLNNYKSEYCSKVVIAGIIGISIMMISEILSIYVYFFLLVIIAFNINMLIRGDKNEISR